ncbi:ClpP/crotonase [Meredithblackwellia eburnea MCA 4105]
MQTLSTLLRRRAEHQQRVIFQQFRRLRTSVPGSTDPILLHIDGPKAVVTLNRPQTANSMDVDLQQQLTKLMRDLEKDKQIRAIILTGAGKYFCSGMNLGSKGESLSGGNEERHDRVKEMFTAVSENKKPVICVINGSCYGGGNGLAFACDYRIASHPEVKFTMSETRLGVAPALISKYIVREWGPALSREAMLLCRPVTAQELVRTAALQHIAEDGKAAMAHADEVVTTLVGHAPGAIANSKRLVKTMSEQIEATHDVAAKQVFLEFSAPSKEAELGIAAFRAKKKPDWTALAE